MLRPTWIALTMLIAVALAPQAALAWSERPAPTKPDGSAMFTDPDEAVERMAGRSDDGNQRVRTFATPQGGSGSWSFSTTPQSTYSNPSPFNSMFGGGSPWVDRRR